MLFVCCLLTLSAGATLDAWCFSVGFYLIGPVQGQMRVSEVLST